ncbi:diadenylate cyclase [Thermodesulforhabdus norvegica]|uniref:Diadenylate cyclase n=1 Tax=Thermodesulforhabdus norvegica TaxID=39841 RepID=A0A1I4QRW4_9BACT|nr:diadenylate cyclase [Thermodesulforhabdus norvegica]SFM42465.1 TIGR00159 family protein [Thermodesulforhabdus norvegica]
MLSGIIRWQDILDILINSYILFRIYILFHETNAFRVIIGIAILWIAQKVAVGLGLIITSWVLQAIIAVAAIIIIVVFRNELRTVLQVHNLRTFLWGSPLRVQETPSEIIARAAIQMGKKRIGALMVFPGREDITELVHGGIPWNGKVSQEMLLSIFWPDNPVHDGAAIIEGDTVKEVGVLLPLSQRSDLPTFYGTRHRAALGLSERSDALVVVVSEERGRVSVAKKGNIQAVPDVETLKQELDQQAKPGKPVETRKERTRERLKSIIAAVVSLAVITSIWFGFTRSRDVIMAVDVPIEFTGRPADLEILDARPSQVRLHVSGASALMRSLKPQQISVQVSLAKATEGVNALPITQENVYLPPGITLSRIEPHFVEVVLDRIITKKVDVQIDWVGHLDSSLTMLSARVMPKTVTIVGGKSILNSIDTVYTAPVRLDDIKESGTITVPLVLAPASLKLAPGSPERVKIEYTVIPRPSVKETEATQNSGNNDALQGVEAR